MSKAAEGLQLLLDNCTEWSPDYQMAWNTAPGKSEVLLRLVVIRRLHSLYLENYCEMWNLLYTLAYH